MNYYNLGCNTYEESEYIQLCYTKKYSEKQFEAIVFRVVLSILKNEKIKKITFQSLMHQAAEELVKKHGFKEMRFAAQFDVFGWADIVDQKDWESVRDEQLNMLTKYLKTYLIKQ